MNFRASTWFAAAMVVGSACGSDEELPGARTYAYDNTCPTWRCGFNSAEVNGRSLAELNLDGVPNSAGVKIVGFVPPPLRLGFTLGVEGDELIARNLIGTTLRGDQLIGAQILVQPPLGLPLPVTILDTELVDSWAAGRPPIVAYTLVYPEPLELLGFKNVCSGSLLDPLASVATVLGGERYDQTTKTVVANQPRWLTIACAGSAAAKLKLLGYGPQSSATTVARRQATLKMITADYCGGGQSYTANGTPIQWANADGSVVPEGSQLGAVEAVWTHSGALCLGAPRIAGTTPACTLPTCAGARHGT